MSRSIFVRTSSPSALSTYGTSFLSTLAPAPWGTGARAPHFYEWLGKGGGHRRQRLITAMQWYANSTADCMTEIKFYLVIRTSVQEKLIARYSQWNCDPFYFNHPFCEGAGRTAGRRRQSWRHFPWQYNDDNTPGSWRLANICRYSVDEVLTSIIRYSCEHYSWLHTSF